VPADERIKVIFKRVTVRNDADTFGSGEFYFEARVGTVSVGNPNRIFDAVEGQTIDLPEDEWSEVVNVRHLRDVVVTFVGKDEDVFVDDTLGEPLRHTLRRPYRQRVHYHSTSYYLLEWHVELVVGGRFGRHPADSVFACRQAPGSVTCTTVSGGTVRSRMEFHPVRPVPTTPPASSLPNRPAIAGAAATNGGNTTARANSPMNVIPNPAVIPILGPPNAAPTGPHTPAQLDEANWANPRNVARIEYTYYQPATLNFTDDDPRLEWSFVGIAGGATVQFLRSDGTVGATDHGRRVMVYGTRAGEVRLQVRFQGAIFATYRALVQEIRQVPCRIQILNGPRGAQPRATPADAKNHLDISNRFLRQIGLQLTLDTNARRRNGARATGIPGIFRIRVSRGRTRNVRNTNRATILNYRPGVMNFAYIHSDRSGNLGAATDFPASNAGASITDPPTGTAGTVATPSTSWIRPTGVGVGADATTATVTMNLIAARQRARHAQLFAMYVTDSNGGANHRALASQQLFACTMAHEFGHILNLGHRVEGVPGPPRRDMTAADPLASLVAGGIFWDGLLHPPHENVMQWWDPSTIAQDFDIIQARAVQQSPLVAGAPTMAPAVAGRGGGGGGP